MRFLLPMLAGLLALLPLQAQLASQDVRAELSTEKREKLEALRTIALPLAATLGTIENYEAELETASSDYAKEEIRQKIKAEKERLNALRSNFRGIIGGSEEAEFSDEIPADNTLQKQISELVQPVLSAMREATAEPRELDALRKALETAKARIEKSKTVLERIEKLRELTENERLLSELDSAEEVWNDRLARAKSQEAVSEVQIEEKTKDQRSLWERVSVGFSEFFKSRGMNLFLAIFAGFLGFIGTRKLYSWLRKVSPPHKSNRNSFTTRISDILAMLLAIIVALSGIILVFYTRGDWLLLTLVIIFLLGVAWTGKTAVPPYLNQIKMILNLGSVREGERVIFNDLPWKVSQLGFYTTFTNSRLDGGKLRVPISEVMDLISRPLADREVWFPTEVNDWVKLSDDTYGKTITQTPEQIVVLRLGGSMKTYSTVDFLSLAPENLSHGFRISAIFGIDYAHQEECTGKIPEIFQNSVSRALIGEFGKDSVKSVKVEFASASASSLDYEILADFTGETASKLNAIRRRVQSACVDTCNEQGWIIPFTQITVHQAEDE
ncbi:MAG: hypothetical protein AB8D78_03105 [Akkermansiaceae bacterium]